MYQSFSVQNLTNALLNTFKKGNVHPYEVVIKVRSVHHTKQGARDGEDVYVLSVEEAKQFFNLVKSGKDEKQQEKNEVLQPNFVTS